MEKYIVERLYNFFENQNPVIGMVNESNGMVSIKLTFPGTRDTMIYNPNPNNDYWYGKTKYDASFILKIEKEEYANDTVAILFVFSLKHNMNLAQKILLNNDFPDGVNYYSFE